MVRLAMVELREYGGFREELGRLAPVGADWEGQVLPS